MNPGMPDLGASDLSKRANKNDIAIVGMACRFPGLANTPDEFWKLLSEGRDAVTEVDDSRWSKEHYFHADRKQPGRSYTWAAGVLEDIDKFDADFFGISPREAAQMDPQQRLLLEMVWEALEDGGQVPENLARSDCGVYIGISGTDYANSRIDDPASGDAYTMTGGTLSIAANRISYLFDLCGPSMAIDTACSSSLVALHQACQSIWNGETTAAITGGINLLLIPFNFIGFSRASMLSPRGRCRAFDATGDGYVRSEGGAILYLKPLAQAKADGDPVHAVITATGVNSDGRTKGLSMPSSEAQERLLRQIYARPDLDPSGLVYVEAHGTGTAAGDPQEARAIGRALGMQRAPDQPLPIGSVKTNVGHLEPASGMAGVMKSILSLEHGVVPKTLHIEEPNPNIPFQDLNLEIVTEQTDLPAPEQTARPAQLIGVNSFGFGGTNAHVVLRGFEPRKRAGTQRRQRKPAPLALSARSDGALAELAQAYADRLDQEPDTGPYELAYNAWHSRQHLNHRLAVWGEDRGEIVSALRAVAAGEKAPNAVSGKAGGATSAPIVFLFSGNGSQWSGMAQELLRKDRLFKRTVQQFDEIFEPMAGFSVLDKLCAEPDPSVFEHTEIAQPALFAVQAGLIACLAARGLKPDYVMGHSVGEVAAAYASGAFSLEQATRLIFERSRAQGMTKGAGKMAAAGLSAEACKAAIDELGLDIEIAACNSAKSVTVSGQPDDLAKLGEHFKAEEVFYRILDLDYAFHSKLMDPVETSLIEALRTHGLEPGSCDVRMVSTVSGEFVAGSELAPEYWWHNIRQPVRLDLALEAVLKEQADDAAPGPMPVVVEVGPQPIMQGYVRESLRGAGGNTGGSGTGASIGTLKRGESDVASVWNAVLGSHVNGAALDSKALFPVKATPVKLPGYPWQRERYWYQHTTETLTLLGPSYDHPLLGYQVPRSDSVWETYLDTVRLPYLQDHVVGGAVVFPAAGFVEMALAASASVTEGPSHSVENLTIFAPLLLNDDETKVVQLRLTAKDRSFEIRSRPRLSDQAWATHVTGRLAGPSTRERPAPADVGESWSRRAEQVSAATHYARTANAGLEYGPAFQAVETVFVGQAETRVNLCVPEALEQADGYALHPALLDACLQSLADTLAGDAGHNTDGLGFLPFQVGRLVFYGEERQPSRCRVIVTRKSARSILADFILYDDSGNAVAELRGFRFRRMRLARGGRGAAAAYAPRLKLAPRVDDQKHGLLPAPGDLAESLVEELAEQWYVMHRADHYGEVLPLLDALVAGYAFDALRELKGGRAEFDVRELMRSCGIPAANEAWLNWLLGILEEDNLAERVGREWRLMEAEQSVEPDEIWRVLLADFPNYLPEITLAGRVGSHLADLLRGDYEPRAILSNGSQTSAADQLLEFSPALRITERAAADVVAAIAEHFPFNRTLRVLEVSLGSGALSAEIAEVLPEGRGRYVLACEGDQAAKATAVLSDYPQIKVQEVDFSQNLSEQGLETHAYDVVLITHLLHSVDEPRTLLASLRQLMVSDGVLIALERPPERLSDFVFGADVSWWARSRQPRDPQSRLRESNAWQTLLGETGFADSIELAEPAPDVPASSYLVLARNPELAEIDPEQAAHVHRNVLVVCEPKGYTHAIAEGLKTSLEGVGDGVLLVNEGEAFSASASELTIDPQDSTHWHRLFQYFSNANASFDEIIYLVGLELDPQTEQNRDPMAGQARRCMPVLHLVNGLRGVSLNTMPRIWLVGSGSIAIDDVAAGAAIPSQAPLRGLGRVLENEHPDIRWKLLDLATGRNINEASRLLASEVMSPDDEDEVVRGPQARYALRLEKSDLDRSTIKRTAREGEGIRLDFSTPGPLSNLHWRAEDSGEPGPGEIRIKVEATGLNFRDVMYAMGMLSDEAVENGFAGASLGMECAGDIVAVGPDVTGFEVGDPVVCFARACFASHVTTPTTAVAHKPKGWSYTEAATIPSVFFTVYYALSHLAQLQPGEKILIHGAAGGVGLAAIQFARFCDAEIFATAGSEEKRDFLKLLGVDHILDSRSLAFADQILDLTGGEGVDVVLNSLSGEAVIKNLDVLKPFGRFLELGKRDFYENAKIGLRPFRNNITYYGIDADQLLVERSDLAGRLFREMMKLFEQGAFRPLVHREFPASRITDAFRHMQQSRHIGKIIVTYDDLPRIESPASAVNTDFTLDTEASYLITGGLGGFGIATAAWLAEKGARHIALAGRSGAATDAAQEAVRALEDAGAKVHVLSVDVTDEAALRKVLKPFGQKLPPIKGVIHAAMVLEDGLSQDMSAESLEKVLRPKVAGAWNLHRCTKDLDFFVMYSSATTDFGNPGQGNYVAANLYLESLASYRRALGLPALSIGWGPIADVGYLARNEEVREALDSRVGGQALTSAAALGWLERLLAADLNSLSVADLDWRVLRKSLPAARLPKFEPLFGAGDDAGEGGSGEDIQALVANLSQDEVDTLVTEMLIEQIAKVMRTSPDKLDVNQSVYDLGMDSLMAVELHMGLEEKFGINIPIMAVTEGASIAKLGTRIAGQLMGSGQASEAPGSAENATVAKLVSQHGEEVDDEDMQNLVNEVLNPDAERRRLIQ